jgi:hypothetical protein
MLKKSFSNPSICRKSPKIAPKRFLGLILPESNFHATRRHLEALEAKKTSHSLNEMITIALNAFF